MDLKERLLEAAIDAFNEKGAKLTLADISKSLSISKKTIYTVFQDKESLLSAMVDYGFTSIKENEKRLLDDPDLSTLEKIQEIVIVIPDRFKQLDFRQFITIKEKYPKLYKQIQKRIETEWEPTLSLFEQAIEEGVIRPIPLPVLKAMIEASIEHFLDSQQLVDQGYLYTDSLKAMMDILMQGLKTR